MHAARLGPKHGAEHGGLASLRCGVSEGRLRGGAVLLHPSRHGLEALQWHYDAIGDEQ